MISFADVFSPLGIRYPLSSISSNSFLAFAGAVGVILVLSLNVAFKKVSLSMILSSIRSLGRLSLWACSSANKLDEKLNNEQFEHDFGYFPTYLSWTSGFLAKWYSRNTTVWPVVSIPAKIMSSAIVTAVASSQPLRVNCSKTEGCSFSVPVSFWA